jgi:hypothetical protein
MYTHTCLHTAHPLSPSFPHPPRAHRTRGEPSATPVVVVWTSSPVPSVITGLVFGKAGGAGAVAAAAPEPTTSTSPGYIAVIIRQPPRPAGNPSLAPSAKRSDTHALCVSTPTALATLSVCSLPHPPGATGSSTSTPGSAGSALAACTRTSTPDMAPVSRANSTSTDPKVSGVDGRVKSTSPGARAPDLTRVRSLFEIVCALSDALRVSRSSFGTPFTFTELRER